MLLCMSADGSILPQTAAHSYQILDRVTGGCNSKSTCTGMNILPHSRHTAATERKKYKTA